MIIGSSVAIVHSPDLLPTACLAQRALQDSSHAVYRWEVSADASGPEITAVVRAAAICRCDVLVTMITNSVVLQATVRATLEAAARSGYRFAAWADTQTAGDVRLRMLAAEWGVAYFAVPPPTPDDTGAPMPGWELLQALPTRSAEPPGPAATPQPGTPLQPDARLSEQDIAELDPGEDHPDHTHHRRPRTGPGNRDPQQG